jgi:hypothetical protein
MDLNIKGEQWEDLKYQIIKDLTLSNRITLLLSGLYKTNIHTKEAALWMVNISMLHIKEINIKANTSSLMVDNSTHLLLPLHQSITKRSPLFPQTLSKLRLKHT